MSDRVGIVDPHEFVARQREFYELTRRPRGSLSATESARLKELEAMTERKPQPQGESSCSTINPESTGQLTTSTLSGD